MFFLIPIVWFIFGIVAGVIGSAKGRGGCGWFVLGLILGPIALFVALLPTIENPGITRKCPFCSEIIKYDANVCRFCGKDLPEPPRASIWKRRF